MNELIQRSTTLELGKGTATKTSENRKTKSWEKGEGKPTVLLEQLIFTYSLSVFIDAERKFFVCPAVHRKILYPSIDFLSQRSGCNATAEDPNE